MGLETQLGGISLFKLPREIRYRPSFNKFLNSGRAQQQAHSKDLAKRLRKFNELPVSSSQLETGDFPSGKQSWMRTRFRSLLAIA